VSVTVPAAGLTVTGSPARVEGKLLADHVTIVVGASSGIGRAVAEQFVAQGAVVVGVDVARCGIEELADRSRGAVVPVVGDVTQPDVAVEAASLATARFGRIDTLVCCAGRFDFRVPISTLDVRELGSAFDEIFAVNVKSMLFAVHAAAPELVRSRGSVVLTLSSSAIYPEGAGVLYGASKWAGRGLVVHLARELAPAVRVNGVAPGGTDGTRLAGLGALGQHQSVDEVPGRSQRIAEATLLGRAAGATDHAGAYLYLASRDLSPLVTGTVVCSDGGRGEPLGDDLRRQRNSANHDDGGDRV